MTDISNIIEKLKNFNIEVIYFKKLREGRNSFSFLLNDYDKKYFLKIFKKNDINYHDRIESELSFSSFLTINEFDNIPKIVLYDKNNSWILYKWIDGNVIKKISKFHVETLLQFLKNINNPKFKINYLPYACESCFSLIDHKNLIYERIDNTLRIINQIKLKDCENEAIMSQLIDDIQERIDRINISFDNISKSKCNFLNHKLMDYQRLLSPSDVGFHNILENQGKLYFVDFEYAGIDDPFKLISDLVLQPDNSIPNKYINLLKEFINKFKKDITLFEKKLSVSLDLYSLKWTCIILNPLFQYKSNNEIANRKYILNKALNYLINIENKKKFFIEIINN